MQDKITDPDAGPFVERTERRAWEAPRLTAVTPVDRTRGGPIVDIGEGGNYQPS